MCLVIIINNTCSGLDLSSVLQSLLLFMVRVVRFYRLFHIPYGWSKYIEYAPLKPKKREGKDSMEAAIFLATKKRGEHGEILEEEENNEENNYDGQNTGAQHNALPTDEDDYDPAL